MINLKFTKNKTNPQTVSNYMNALEKAFVIEKAPRYDIKGKELLASTEKYYVADHGVREAVFGGNMKDINLVLENIVYMELLRRGYRK